jgi:hypothetical protein
MMDSVAHSLNSFFRLAKRLHEKLLLLFRIWPNSVKNIFTSTITSGLYVYYLEPIEDCISVNHRCMGRGRGWERGRGRGWGWEGEEGENGEGMEGRGEGSGEGEREGGEGEVEGEGFWYNFLWN